MLRAHQFVENLRHNGIDCECGFSFDRRDLEHAFCMVCGRKNPNPAVLIFPHAVCLSGHKDFIRDARENPQEYADIPFCEYCGAKVLTTE